MTVGRLANRVVLEPAFFVTMREAVARLVGETTSAALGHARLIAVVDIVSPWVVPPGQVDKATVARLERR